MIRIVVRRDQIKECDGYVTLMIQDYQVDDILDQIFTSTRCEHTWVRVHEDKKQLVSTFECQICGRISKACMT